MQVVVTIGEIPRPSMVVLAMIHFVDAQHGYRRAGAHRRFGLHQQ